MPQNQPTEPITVRAKKEIVTEIDALASAMDRSRNYVVVQALEQYLETNAWQIERIKTARGSSPPIIRWIPPNPASPMTLHFKRFAGEHWQPHPARAGRQAVGSSRRSAGAK